MAPVARSPQDPLERGSALLLVLTMLALLALIGTSVTPNVRRHAQTTYQSGRFAGLRSIEPAVRQP